MTKLHINSETISVDADPQMPLLLTIRDMPVTSILERPGDATANAAWAFREFWRTGDEACLTRALAENFAAHPGSERGRQLQPSDEESK